MADNEQTKSEIWAVIQGLFDAYARRDLDKTMSYFAPENVVAIGSGLEERSVGFEAVRESLSEDFAENQDVSIEFPWHHVELVGTGAYAAAECRFTVRENGESVELVARFTAVLERSSAGWRIVHTHLSSPTGLPESPESESPND